MGLFSMIPPELVALLSNPKALGEQVKAFYVAAKDLLDAIEAHKKAVEFFNSGEDDEHHGENITDAEAVVWATADAFRAELEKLPPLDKVTK